MSNYGIEIFNSLGELVFSSDRRTVQILKAGTVSLGWGWNGVYVEFEPVVERPQIFAQTTGRYNIYAHNIQYYDYIIGAEVYDIDWWRMAAFVGPFQKNSQGLYYRIRIGSQNMYKWRDSVYRSRTPGANSGNPLDNIPYVIFK